MERLASLIFLKVQLKPVLKVKNPILDKTKRKSTTKTFKTAKCLTAFDLLKIKMVIVHFISNSVFKKQTKYLKVFKSKTVMGF